MIQKCIERLVLRGWCVLPSYCAVCSKNCSFAAHSLEEYRSFETSYLFKNSEEAWHDGDAASHN
jgi:hypothetical protein